MSDKNKLKDFVSDLKDKFGEDVVVTTESHLEAGVISTGSLSLDVSLGIGGIPRGTFTEIYGPESSGKTTLALAMVKEAIKDGLSVLYIEVERALDYRYIRAVVGDFDESKLVLASPQTAEDAFLTAEEGINSGAFGLIVVDSLGAMSPKKELDDDLTDANVALLSRILTRFLRRNSFAVKRNKIAFVFLNQVRANIGSYMGGYVSTGGHALKHFITIQIKFTKGMKITQGTGKQKEIVGILTNFSVSKNKLAPPFRTSTVPIMFGKGVDYERDVLNFATSLGVVRTAGSFYRFEEETLGQGQEKAKQYLSTMPTTLDRIVNSCYNTLGIKKETLDKGEKQDE